jgi:hypothetical protein
MGWHRVENFVATHKEDEESERGRNPALSADLRVMVLLRIA